MRYVHFILGLVCTLSVGCSSAPLSPSTRALSGSEEALARAFEQHTSNVQVEGQGVIRRVLSDDNNGSRHQRFVVALSSGQTLLIAHNIDLAPKVVGLREGDIVSFSGEYQWNAEGGRDSLDTPRLEQTSPAWLDQAQWRDLPIVGRTPGAHATRRTKPCG